MSDDHSRVIAIIRFHAGATTNTPVIESSDFTCHQLTTSWFECSQLCVNTAGGKSKWNLFRHTSSSILICRQQSLLWSVNTQTS